MPLSVEVPHLAILADPAEGEEYGAAPTEVRAHLVLEAARSEPEVAAEVESEAVANDLKPGRFSTVHHQGCHECARGVGAFFPDVEDVVVTQSGTNMFDFAVTICSPYDLTCAILAPSCLG